MSIHIDLRRSDSGLSRWPMFHDSVIFAGATASVGTWLLPSSDVPRLGWFAQTPDVRSSASTEHGGSLRARREEGDILR